MGIKNRVGGALMLILIAGSGAARADDYAGRYQLVEDGETMVLTLMVAAPGRYEGTFDVDGYAARVEAAMRGPGIVGQLFEPDGEMYAFDAERTQRGLLITFEDGELLHLLSSTNAASSRAPVTRAGPDTGRGQVPDHRGANAQVHVNGQPVSSADLAQFAAYGIQVQPGSYWYDPVCGAWGAWGGPTAGFVQPGLPSPPLPAHASAGTTGVYVNGRVINAAELAYLQALAGGWIAPGRYWLDPMGNAGYEGGPALINYLQAARNVAGRGGTDAWYGNGASGWSGSDGSGGVWIANPYGGTGTTVTY